MPGLSDQTVPGMPAGDGSPVCWPYGQTHNSSGDKTEGDRTGAGRHAAEAGRQTAWRGRWRGAQLGQGVPQGAAWPRCSPGTRMPPRAGNRRPSVLGAGRMPGDGDDVEALRRRVEELESGERVDAGGGGGSQKKTRAPTCGACRTGRRRCRSTG